MPAAHFVPIKFLSEMAHEINYNKRKGTHSFASAIHPAWHDLGQILPERMTAREAIENANLDFEVEKRQLYVLTHPDAEEGTAEYMDTMNPTTHYANVRTDTNQILGVVGSKYHIVQNHQCFSFFDSIVDQDAAIYETAGALGNGERIFITAKLPDTMKIGNDQIEKYIFLTSSHDGSGGIMAAFTPTRIVCANTLRMALNNKTGEVNIRHTAGAGFELRQAAYLMGIVANKSDEMERNFLRFSKMKCDDNLMMNLLEEVFKPTNTQMIDASKWVSRRADEVINYHHTAETQRTKETSGTLYGMVNAVSGFYQNVHNFKTNEAKLNSIINGRANTYSLRAYDKAVELADIYDNTKN
jgi:phage/plasmid-like protein (TIGR03299 family)